MRYLRILLLACLCAAVPSVGFAGVLMGIAPCAAMQRVSAPDTLSDTPSTSPQSHHSAGLADGLSPGEASTASAHACCPPGAMAAKAASQTSSDTSPENLFSDTSDLSLSAKGDHASGSCSVCNACGSYPVVLSVWPSPLNGAPESCTIASTSFHTSFDKVAIWRPPASLLL